MDNCLESQQQLDFYSDQQLIAQYTKKLRPEDLKVVTSIPEISFVDEAGIKGSPLDTPEVSLNLSDFIDTPDFNKFTSGEGLFPQVDLLTSSQDEKLDSAESDSVISNIATVTVSDTTPTLSVSTIKQEPIEVMELDNSQMMSNQADDMETIDIASLMQQQQQQPAHNNIVLLKSEVPDMGSFVTIPESPSDFSDSNRSFEYEHNVPTPVQEVETEYDREDLHYGKSPPPSKGIRKRDLEKGSDEYKMKRERNNIAVRKSREKARERQRQTEQKVKTLVAENKQLTKKLELVTKELTVLRGLFSNANLRQLMTPQHQKLLDKLNL